MAAGRDDGSDPRTRDRSGEPARETGDQTGPASGDTLPQVRASDEERLQVVELLGDHASVGRLTLAELEERVAAAYAAATRGDLAELTKDLPESSEAPTRQRKISRWFVAIMGGSTWRGRRRLSHRVNVVAIMGGDTIDLREAVIEGRELVINVFSLMGGPDIYLPDSIEVEVTGTSIMGGNDERGSTRQPRPGSPLIHIRSLSLMGGANIWRLPAETSGMGLKEARRIAKQLERGHR